MLLALLACAAPGSTVKDEPAPAGIPAGWTLGEVAACDAAGPPTWTEDPSAHDTYALGAHQGHEPGGVGIVEVEGEDWIVWAPPNTGALARPLRSGAARAISDSPVFGFAQADLDGDGAVDLLFAHHVLTVLWGFGTNHENAEEFRPEGGGAVRDVAILDVDGDDLLDLVLSFTHPDHENVDALRGELRRNEGRRQFADPVPIDAPDAFWGPSFDLTVFDLEGDGAPDVYVCNDVGFVVAPNGVLGNVDGALSPVDGRGLDVRTNCMGTAMGDLDADGGLDAYVGAAGDQRLLVTEAGGWYDEGDARGLPSLRFPDMAWGSALGDLDNDGRADLLVATSDFYGPVMSPDALWWLRQAEDGTFVEEGAARGFPTLGHTRTVVTRDLNDDGVPDIVVGDALRSPWIWWSDGCSEGAWLTVEAPLGSEVVVRAGARAWAAQVTTDASWASTGPARAHVGLGNVEEVDAIEIAAPWRPVEVLPGPIATRRVVTWAPED